MAGESEPNPHLSVRGRNLLFVETMADILQLNSGLEPLTREKYKKAFTKSNVVKIHEGLMDYWPPDININDILKTVNSDVSGLYIGDYSPQFIFKSIIRHSTYADKIILVDPFTYPSSVNDNFNPILNPEQYRTQTLKNVNFWLSLYPWIAAGLVEIIRTPLDFDHRLQWDLLKKQQEKFDQNPEFQGALKNTVEDMFDRHIEDMKMRNLLLGSPDHALERMFNELDLGTDKFDFDDLLHYVKRKREEDPDFLDTIDKFGSAGQLEMVTSGVHYEGAKLISQLTGSYLFTDLRSRWKEIEMDRESRGIRNKDWEPFAKAFQDVDLKYLDNINLEQALTLRQEERLKSLRYFLRKVWISARTGDVFDEGNAQLLGEELREEIRKAEEEWKQIDRDLLKWLGAEVGSGLLAAGPLLSTGNGAFLAAAFTVAGTLTLTATKAQRNTFPEKFPAAFFMNLK